MKGVRLMEEDTMIYEAAKLVCFLLAASILIDDISFQ